MEVSALSLAFSPALNPVAHRDLPVLDGVWVVAKCSPFRSHVLEGHRFTRESILCRCGRKPSARNRERTRVETEVPWRKQVREGCVWGQVVQEVEERPLY